jgi:hypothetical protein
VAHLSCAECAAKNRRPGLSLLKVACESNLGHASRRAHGKPGLRSFGKNNLSSQSGRSPVFNARILAPSHRGCQSAPRRSRSHCNHLAKILATLPFSLNQRLSHCNAVSPTPSPATAPAAVCERWSNHGSISRSSGGSLAARFAPEPLRFVLSPGCPGRALTRPDRPAQLLAQMVRPVFKTRPPPIAAPWPACSSPDVAAVPSTRFAVPDSVRSAASTALQSPPTADRCRG